MSIAQLRAVSELDLPLIVDEIDEVLGVRTLIEGGLIVGCGGVIDVLPSGQAVVLHPAVIQNVTAMGRQFLRMPNPRLDSLSDFL